MGFLFKCFFSFLAVVLIWHFLTKKYLNPYKLTMVFGKKGSGKSTLMVRMAYEYLAMGWTVFCTEKLDGCIHINYKDIGYKQIPPQSLLLVDEVGMIWDNRNYKDFKPEVRDWFKLQRHYKVKVVLFSQTFDIDKKLRDLTDDMFLCTNVLRVFSWAKRITRRVVLVQPGPDTPARIDEELAYDPLIWWPFGSRILTFIPSWAPFFDSHNCPQLTEVSWEAQPELKLPKSLKRARNRAQRKRKRAHRFKPVILLRSVRGWGRWEGCWRGLVVFGCFGRGWAPLWGFGMKKRRIGGVRLSKNLVQRETVGASIARPVVERSVLRLFAANS